MRMSTMHPLPSLLLRSSESRLAKSRPENWTRSSVHSSFNIFSISTNLYTKLPTYQCTLLPTNSQAYLYFHYIYCGLGHLRAGHKINSEFEQYMLGIRTVFSEFFSIEYPTLKLGIRLRFFSIEYPTLKFRYYCTDIKV